MKIYANHSTLHELADFVDSNKDTLKENMKKANTAILTISWQGADFKEFKKRWDEFVSKNGTSEGMAVALENFSGLLRQAANLYIKTQTDAANRAGGISHW
jgi:uncharacterized protein YukE